MKRGGRVIYGGRVGERSDILIKYFEVKIMFKYNFYNFTN